MKKKIIIGVSLGLVVAIIATVVTLACVQKSYKPEFDLEPKTITVVELSSKDEFQTGVAYSNKETCLKIEELFEQGFKQSILSSIFTGNSSNKVEVEPVSSLPTFSSGYTVTFEYKADMILKVNGEKYSPNTNSDKQVAFQTIIFNVNEQEGYESFNIYVKEVVGNKTYYYEVSTIANTTELYNYLGELSYN